MKKLPFFCSIVLAFSWFVTACNGIHADDSPPLNLSKIQWQFLRPGATKTDLGKGLPEVIILTLSNDEFEKLHVSEDAAKAYLDALGVFKLKLIKVVFGDVVPNDHGDGWIVLIPHTAHSTACIVAWQLRAKKD